MNTIVPDVRRGQGRREGKQEDGSPHGGGQLGFFTLKSSQLGSAGRRNQLVWLTAGRGRRHTRT